VPGRLIALLAACLLAGGTASAAARDHGDRARGTWGDQQEEAAAPGAERSAREQRGAWPAPRGEERRAWRGRGPDRAAPAPAPVTTPEPERSRSRRERDAAPSEEGEGDAPRWSRDDDAPRGDRENDDSRDERDEPDERDERDDDDAASEDREDDDEAVAAPGGDRSSYRQPISRSDRERPAVAPAATPQPAAAAPAPAPAAASATPAPGAAPGPATTTPRRGVSRRPLTRTRERAATRGRIERSLAPSRSAVLPAAADALVTPRAVVIPDASPAPERSTTPRPRTDLSQFAIETRPARPSAAERIVEVVPQALRQLLAALGVLALLLLAAVAGAAARARGAERRRRELAADVGLLQSALLPELPPRIGAVALSAAYRPSDGPAAGGDFHDAFALDEHRTCVIVGDVAGHGRDALPLTAAVRFTVRAHLEAGATPRRALALAGEALDSQLKERLVTVVAAVFDARSNQLTYACAGHPAPIVAGHPPLPREAAASLPLGAGAPTGRRATTVTLHPGAVVCFHTDGVFDVTVDGGRLGAGRLVEELAALGSEPTARELLGRVTQRSLRQPDDMTALLLRVGEAAPAAACERMEELEVDLEELAGPRPARFLEMCDVESGSAREVLLDAAGVVAYDGTAVLVVTDGAAVARPAGPVSRRLRAPA
jgi:serine phosphatase RsbU (regulator of sigma subunit)